MIGSPAERSDSNHRGLSMNPLSRNRVIAGAALAAACCSWPVFAQPAGVDAKADAVLRSMTKYMAGLKQFSVQAESTLEVVTTEGQKIQFIAPATVTVSRPDKLHAERRGDIVDQSFYYDGKSLTLYDPATKYYATVPAPANIDAMLDFARTKLDVFAPGSDLIDTRAYERLMQDVKAGTYLGLAVVGGYRCHHVAYRGAEVDWQLWVREGNQSIPCRYVITSKDIAGAPQFTTQIVKFDAAPKIDAARFRFTPPAGSRPVEFLPAGRAR
jgi:hypothetical protein